MCVTMPDCRQGNHGCVAVPVSPLFTSSSGGDKHRETQLQLQRKLQERELLREQKKKVQQQRNEIQQEQLRSVSRGPSTTPTKSPLPRAFSKTPTPIRSPLLRPPSSMKSPGPTVTFGQMPTLGSSVQKPTKCVSRNITKLLQSPVQAGKAGQASQPIKMEESDAMGTELSAGKVSLPGAMPASVEPSSSCGSNAGMEGSEQTVSSGEMSSKTTFRVSTLDRNLLGRSGHQLIISGSQGLILDQDLFHNNADPASSSVFKNTMHVVQKPVVVSASSGVSQQAVATAQLQATGMSESLSSLPGSMNAFGGSVGNLSGSIGNLSSSSSSVSSFDSVHLGQTITIVSKVKDGSTEQLSGDIESIAPPAEKNYLPGNSSTRSAFVPVSNQRIALTLMAPSHSSMSESSSDESKDQEEPSLPMDQSEALGSSGGFQTQQEAKSDSGTSMMSVQQSDSSPSTQAHNMPTPSQGRGQRKAKNRFTPIRPKAPQPPLPPTASSKEPKTPEKDSRPVSALLKEKRAREAQEVLQHLASSFQHQSSSGKAFPSSLSLPAEVLGLSPDRACGGKEVVIILTSPSAGSSRTATSLRDQQPGEEKASHEKHGSVARSMSDILIANPNFFQKKEAMPTAVSHQVSATGQVSSQHSLREKVSVASSDVTTKTVTVQGQDKIQDGTWEVATSVDEEVTQHMTNARHLLPESRGTDTPNTRKRKSSGQGNSNHNKRLNSATEERKLELEDDDVFIVDAPSASPQPRLLTQSQRLVRQVLTEATGRVVRRLDAMSPCYRPGSSTLVDMQVDEPVSRCQSTGVGMDKTTYSAAATWLATELSRQSSGKLNVESLESDALADTDLLPPSTSSSAHSTKNSVSQHQAAGMTAGITGALRTGGNDLAAVQQALLQEKQLLDARFDSIWNKLQNADMATSPPLAYNMAPQTSESQRDISATDVIHNTGTCTNPGRSTPVANQLAKVHSTSVQGRQATDLVHMYQGGEDVQCDGQSVQIIPSSQSLSIDPSNQTVQVNPTTRSVHIDPTTQTVQISPTTQSVHIDPKSQAVHIIPNSQSFQISPNNHSVQINPVSQSVQLSSNNQTVRVTPSKQAIHINPSNQTFHINPTNQAVQAHSSNQQLDQLLSSSQSVMVRNSGQAVPQSEGQTAQVESGKQTIQTLSSQRTAWQTVSKPVSKSVFKTAAVPQKPPDISRESAKQQDASMNVDTFSVDPSHFLSLVQGIVSEQTKLAQQEQQSGMSKSRSPPSHTSSIQTAAVEKSTSLAGQRILTCGSLVQPTHVLATPPQDGAVIKAPASLPKGKAASTHPPPPNTLLALLQSPALSAICPPVSGRLSMRKASAPDKPTQSMSSMQEQGGLMALQKVSQAAESLPVPGAPSSHSPPVAGLSSQQALTASGIGSHDQVSYSGLGHQLSKPQASLVSSSSVGQVTDSSALPSQVPSHLEDSYLPDSMRTLGPVPASLPANFLAPDPQSEVEGELPVDVADFVTEHSLKAQQQQQQQQLLQQQLLQQQMLLQQGEPQLLETELETLLLQQTAGGLVSGSVRVEEKSGLVTSLSAAVSDDGAVSDSSTGSHKETFPMPSNPAPKQRLSEGGAFGSKKYPAVQRSASLPGLVVRGLANKPGSQDVPVSPSPSPTRDPTPSSVGMVSMRHTRHSTDSGSSKTDVECIGPETSPLMPGPPPTSIPSQEAQAVGLISLRRNPLLSTSSDPSHTTSNESLTQLSQGSQPSSQGGLSNPGSVSAVSPVDWSVTSPITFMPIQVSPSSASSTSGRSTVTMSQQQYIPPIRPVVTVASVAVAGQESETTQNFLLSKAVDSKEGTCTTSWGQTGQEESEDLLSLTEMSGDGGVQQRLLVTEGAASKLLLASSAMDTSPASSVSSVKSEPGTSASRLMSISPCPGTVPYNVPSPWGQATGVSPGPSPTPATSNASSPSASSAGHRGSAGQGVLQQLLSTRSAPPSYAESVQLRLLASGQLAGSHVIGGSTEQRQATGNYVGGNGASSDRAAARARSGSTQARVSGPQSGRTGSSHADTSSERRGQVAGEEVSSSARSVVHHVPSTPNPTPPSTGRERSGRRIPILKRDKGRSSSSATTSTPKVAAAASDAILKGSLASPTSALDPTDPARPFSQKLQRLKQQRQQLEGGRGTTGGKPLQVASPPTATVLAGGVGSVQPDAGGVDSAVKLAPSPGSARRGRSSTSSSLGPPVASPATPTSPASAPSPSSQGQGQVLTPLRVSTSASSPPDVFINLPVSFPQQRLIHPFSPQQQSSSSSSSSPSMAMSQGALYQPFTLPDMNYMGNAPNIDLSQLMEGKTNTAPSEPAAAATVGQHSTQLQGLDDLQSTLEILQGMDSHYFNAHQPDSEDLMRSVFGDLAQELQGSVAVSSSQDEEEEEGEEACSGAPTPRIW